MNMNSEQMDLLKEKYLDHAEDLRFRTGFDFKLLSGFITLNLVLAAWLSKYPLSTGWYKAGFVIFVGGLCFVAILLFHRNNRRRKVVVEIMHNLNDAFGFDKDGVYRDNGPINPKSNLKTTYWFRWYICVVILFFLSQMFIILGTPLVKTNDVKFKQHKEVTQQAIEQDRVETSRVR